MSFDNRSGSAADSIGASHASATATARSEDGSLKDIGIAYLNDRIESYVRIDGGARADTRVVENLPKHPLFTV